MGSERKQNSEEKVGVYICYCGGNISDHVDVQRLADRLKELPGVTASRTNMFMCSDPGQELIQEDIKSGEVNRVVVASCAPHLHETTFRAAIKRAGMNPYLYEHANIREQVSWVHDGDPATDKAERLVAAAIAKAKKLRPLDPIRVEATNHATVIGGGVAGLSAARDLSRRGIEVVLVERSPFLGGQAAMIDRLAPTGEKAGGLIKQLAGEVLGDSNITVYTCAEVVESSGYVGNFKVKIRRRPPESKEDLEKLDVFEKLEGSEGDFVPFAGVCPMDVPTGIEEKVHDTGAIVFATGFRPYTPRQGEYGYGDHPEAITLPELIKLMSEDKSRGRKLRMNGKEISRVGLIHCVGSRHIRGINEPDADGHLNEYCSRVCCTATLQAANDLREKYPETHVFDFHRDIRTYARGHEEVYERACNNNVTFFRFEAQSPPVVEKNGSYGHPLRVKVKDVLTFGEEVEAEVDLVVLSVGLEPSNILDLVDMMKLPVGADRFLLEVHPKLRPVEIANTGILLAGTCQAPMDTGEACSAAQAAAVKVSALLTKGYVELDPFVAQVDLKRCTGHGLCAEACPFEDTIQLTEMEVDGKRVKRAQVNSALCNGCGICVAVCPNNAIDVGGWRLDQYEAMVDAIVTT